jgi:uncharacterized radical SAM protein YgiQ
VPKRHHQPDRRDSPPLPTTTAEARRRGWDELDVVLVSGDAYVDHPAFAAGILGRVLEAEGFRVGVLSQPDWRSAEPFRALGRPRLFFGVGAGNVDSMLAHYTPRRRKRSDDPYAPGGQAGRRPDRATAVYAQRCREAFPRVPVIVGGIEASLRRVAHWDHWSRTVRPSILASAKADLLVFGMGERTLVLIARALADGARITELRDLAGTAHLLGKRDAMIPDGGVELPSFEQCAAEPARIGEVTRLVAHEGSAATGRPLAQRHGDRLLVVRPPAAPPTTAELDRWHDLPFTRREHPSLGASVPALETVRWSVITHRGCFGGCSFCSLAEHQGRAVVGRSPASITREVASLARDPRFPGTLADLGGPSANMYGLGCMDPEQEARCRRRSCLWPRPCKLLRTDPGPWLDLLARARRTRGVRKVRVASGVRMDLLLAHPESLDTLAREHVGGQLKVAPEHDRKGPLAAMRKPEPGLLLRFARAFERASRRADKRQYLVPYLIAGHPGTSNRDMAELARTLADLGLRPRQVQDFTPTPMTVSTAQHVAGRDPLDRESTPAVRGDRARDDQHAILQWFLPQHRRRGERLLRELGYGDVIERDRRRR